MLSIFSTKWRNLRNLITCSKQLDFVQDIVRATSSSLLVHFSPRGMSSKPSLTFWSSSLHDVQIEINLCSIYKETSTTTYTNIQFEKFIKIRYKVSPSFLCLNQWYFLNELTWPWVVMGRFLKENMVWKLAVSPGQLVTIEYIIFIELIWNTSTKPFTSSFINQWICASKKSNNLTRTFYFKCYLKATK